MSNEWIQDEFNNLSLGDKRVDERFLSTMNILSMRPEDCINRAIGDWASKKAAYRLFSNDRLDPNAIIACHREKTKERMKDYKVVLSIHDSTYFGFGSKRSIEGLGNIGGHSRVVDGEIVGSHGFIGHYALAVTEEGLPLGIQGVKFWSRAYDSHWEKESERWGELCDEVEELYGPKTKMIYIADREADMFELFFQNQVDKVDFVIRAKVDRLIHGKRGYLDWELKDIKYVDNIQLYCPKRKKIVQGSLRYARIGFNDPEITRAKHLLRKDIRHVELNVVEVREKDNRTTDALHWILYTSLKIETADDALKVVNYYRQRWHIENYFKVLKGGCCKVENCGLKSYEKLIRYISAFSVLSWRLYWARHINGIAPDAPAELILSPYEREVIRLRIKKRNSKPNIKKITPPVATIRDALRYIAGMGGFNGRKGDGEPGIITLWRGFIRLQDKAETLEDLSSDLGLVIK